MKLLFVIHMWYKVHYCKQTNTTVITFPLKPHDAYLEHSYVEDSEEPIELIQIIWKTP